MIAVSQSHCADHAYLRRNHAYDRQYDAWRKSNKPAAERHDFYHKQSWKSMRLHILERDNYLCRYCNLIGHVSVANTVDHIVPREVSRDKELTESNLVSSCASCHNIKTKWEQVYYGAGQKNRLNPDAVKIFEIKDLLFVFDK